MKEQIATIKEQIARMETNTVQVKDKVVGMEREMESGMEKVVKEMKDEMATEKEEQEQRAANITIHGVKESEKSTGKERKDDDAEAVRKIAAEIGVEIKRGNRGEVQGWEEDPTGRSRRWSQQ